MYIKSVHIFSVINKSFSTHLDSSSESSSSEEEEAEEEEDEEDVVKVISTAGNTSIGQWEEHTNVCTYVHT